MAKPLLPNVTLCAIVRDEVENPAGGIIDFVKSTVPFVEEVVIVDTGSIDGTAEIVEQLASQYHNLRVYHTIFRGYAEARNESLAKSTTAYVLVLDADERLTKRDFVKLRAILELEPKVAYNFQLMEISSDWCDISPLAHNPRLFLARSASWAAVYKNAEYRCSEYVYQSYISEPKFGYYEAEDIPITIKHFVSGSKAQRQKERIWYWRQVKNIQVDIIPPPSSLPESKVWKEYNPKRELYY